MASKGQKFKSYSADLKQTILKEYFDGIGTTKTLSLNTMFLIEPLKTGLQN